MEVPWSDKHQPQTLLLWKLSYYGNQSEMSVIPLFQVHHWYGGSLEWESSGTYLVAISYHGNQSEMSVTPLF